MSVIIREHNRNCLSLCTGLKCVNSQYCEFLSTGLESEYQWCGSFSNCQAVMSVPITVKVVISIPVYMYVRCTKNNFTENFVRFLSYFYGFLWINNKIDYHYITELC